MEWTAERIAKLTAEELKALRANAVRLQNEAVVALCDVVLSERVTKRKRTKRSQTVSESHVDEIVDGFHFVCPSERGVTRNDDGTIWTGTWVVDSDHAERGLRNGAYVALHASKAEPSYLQGIIKAWRRARRERHYVEGRPVRMEFGIDFLIQVTSETYEWHGDGAGEKGYAWRKS